MRAVVVCVDDDPAILRAYERLLRDEPYDVLTFDDPGRALDWIERKAVDLVLSDQRMPGMTGTVLLEEVGRRSPWTSCALVTADPEAGSIRGPIRRLIAKPWDDEALKETIRDLLCDRGMAEWEEYPYEPTTRPRRHGEPVESGSDRPLRR